MSVTFEMGVDYYSDPWWRLNNLYFITDKSGLPYQLTPMGTNIKIDYRAGPGGRLQSKLESVQRKLGRPLAT